MIKLYYPHEGLDIRNYETSVVIDAHIDRASLATTTHLSIKGIV
jgi:hypothetical protein